MEFASRSRDLAAADAAYLSGPDVGAISSSDDDDDDVVDGLLHGPGPPLPACLVACLAVQRACGGVPLAN